MVSVMMVSSLKSAWEKCDEMSYVLDIDDKYLNDFVGDYTVFDLMILDANTYIAQLNFSYFILRTWKSKYHCKEVKYSLEEKGLL